MQEVKGRKEPFLEKKTRRERGVGEVKGKGLEVGREGEESDKGKRGGEGRSPTFALSIYHLDPDLRWTLYHINPTFPADPLDPHLLH